MANQSEAQSSKTEELIQVIYVSFTSPEFAPNRDVEQILSASKKNNPQLGISGVLLYRGGVFLQYLEGPEEALNQLLSEKIEKDPRHIKIKYLLRQPLAKRLFGDWEMAYKKVDVDQLEMGMVNAVLDWSIALDKAQSNSTVSDDMLLKMLSEVRVLTSREVPTSS